MHRVLISAMAVGKLHLKGSVQECLQQLDVRETELLQEREKLRGVIRRLRQDRAHYRQKVEEKEYDTRLSIAALSAQNVFSFLESLDRLRR